MMAPILYYNVMSPPVRAVLLAERALGIELEKKEINIKNGDNLTAQYLKMNPQHTVPTLNDGGFCIWDSHAIIAYLVGKYAKDDSLYPKDLQKRAVVDQRLHFDSGILFPSLKAIFYPMFFLGVKEISQEKADALIKALAFLESFLENRVWMAGDQLTIADLCIGASVSSTEAVESLIPVGLDKYPRLQAWMNRVKALPFYEEANGTGLQRLKVSVKQSVAE